MSPVSPPADPPASVSDELDSRPLAVDTGRGQLGDPGDGHGQPLVTAVVTTYDRLEQAKAAIESVLNQTYRPLEIIVVEDGTESGVQEWLINQGHEVIRYVRHTRNHGLPATRNTGLGLASGEYVAFLDDDDRWKPARIERGIDRLRERSATWDSEVGVTYCAAESYKAGQVATIIHPDNDGPLAESIRRNGPSTVESACIFSRAALHDVGGYDESLRSSVDHDIWMALAVGGYAVFAQDEPLVETDIDFAMTMTTDTDNRIAGIRQFVEKWRPTFYEWFGEDEGERRVQRYFADKVARLAAVKLIGGDLAGGGKAVRTVFQGSDQQLYNLAVLGVSIAEYTAKRVLPPAVLRALSRRFG